MPNRNRSEISEHYPGVSCHWDSVHNVYAVRVLPGQYYVTDRSDQMISTVLGSCIAACIRDPEIGVGGLNHFMLPGGDVAADGVAARYGIYAMEHLINDIVRRGGDKRRLEIKLFGGGKIMRGLTDIGAKNIKFVREFLSVEGYPIAAADLGESFSRKVNYFPTTGQVLVKRLRSLHAQQIAREEIDYGKTLVEKPEYGDIELFD
ncbi:chemoreceptor glutamine deamidase CheD [Spongiibacter marinus]|uniref:chemoreceptor glutamine deamidase CheD n=1 Tax=Spongiibacter marinus TaxID=354246 RepID=UPI000684C200|nr:chemoreceptor glutamine deamidase CheD [Spongiibacter marinus]